MIEVSIDNTFGTFRLKMDFSFGPGLTALFGRSGSGKTKLVDAVAGLEQISQGRIVINDQVLLDTQKGINLPPEQRRIGYVFQEARLFPHLSVKRNLTYGMALLPANQRRHTVEEIVDLMSIAHLLERYPATLSGGEKQRIAIGRALLSSPRLLLMDEPLASLDAIHKEEILPFIERLRDETGLPIIYVSHSIEEVIRLADTMALLSDGEIAAQGTVEDVMSRLDLHPLTGRYEAGAVINTVVQGHDDHDGLTSLGCAAGNFLLPRIYVDLGSKIRLRVRARDVSLALDKPNSTSVLNVFKGVITQISPMGPSPHVDFLIDIGVPLIARITRRSCNELKLRPGSTVYAMIKAAAIDRRNTGYARTNPIDNGDENDSGDETHEHLH